MTTSLMQTGVYLFASICLAAILMLLVLWLFFLLDEAWYSYTCRRDKKRQRRNNENK